MRRDLRLERRRQHLQDRARRRAERRDAAERRNTRQGAEPTTITYRFGANT